MLLAMVMVKSMCDAMFERIPLAFIEGHLTPNFNLLPVFLFLLIQCIGVVSILELIVSLITENDSN